MIPNNIDKPDEIMAQCRARDLLREFAITDLASMPLEDIAMAHGALVEYRALDGADARLLRRDGSFLITVNSSLAGVGRKRFALAHELGHLKCHAESSQLSSCGQVELEYYLGSKEELEANAFAVELLMPSYVVRNELEQMPLSLPGLTRFASKYQVSLTAAAVRYVDLSRDTRFFITSRSGVICWWKKQDRAGLRLWLERRQSLNRGSFAYECSNTAKQYQLPGRVDAEVWFGHCRDIDSLRVSELSARLGTSDVVITVLSVDGFE